MLVSKQVLDERKSEFRQILYHNLEQVVRNSALEHRYILHEVKKRTKQTSKTEKEYTRNANINTHPNTHNNKHIHHNKQHVHTQIHIITNTHT
jgi:hypothetical protein